MNIMAVATGLWGQGGVSWTPGLVSFLVLLVLLGRLALFIVPACRVPDGRYLYRLVLVVEGG